MFESWVLNEIYIIDLSSVLVGMLLSSSKLFPLSEEVIVIGCVCGFGFEQKFWRIDGFGEKKARIGGLYIPIHPLPRFGSYGLFKRQLCCFVQKSKHCKFALCLGAFPLTFNCRFLWGLHVV